ncbi:MAG: short-chain dehydrogenase [Rhodospirillaceae bacterium]|nr:short-chain dehydrogenase [Rhodospirillaceae bacterium]
MRLDKKVALITGAGSGIGQAISVGFASEGAHVVCADKNEESAVKTMESILSAGGKAIAVQADVSIPGDCEQQVRKTINQFKRLDVLVNNAGVGFHRLFTDTTLADWNRVIGVNLTGSFLTSQAASREMIKQKSGKIINIGSISGQRGGTGRAAYGASKAGLMQLTRVMAVELAFHGIAVNAIAPGPIQTPLTNHGPEQKKAYIDRIPVKSYGHTDAITGAALFLASEEAQFIHGATINVDGGFNAAGLIFSTDEMLSYESGPADSWTKT